MKQEHFTEHLQKAAVSIVEKMNNPAALTDFLTDALHWIHKYEIKNKPAFNDSMHWHFIVLIKELALPWSTATKKSEIDCLVNGLEKVYDTIGFDGFKKSNQVIMKAYTEELNECLSNESGYQKEMNGIYLLFCIQECLGNYDFCLCEERKEAA
jgi:hypothetical protein